jgi:hypothetical protein
MGADLMLAKISGSPLSSSIPVIVDGTGRLIQTQGGKIVGVSHAVGLAAGGAYAAGDFVANGGILVPPSGCDQLILEGLTVIDLDAANVGFQILFYAQTPGAGTWVDNAALSPSDAESAKLCALLTVQNSDFESIGVNSMADFSGLDIPLFGGTGVAAALPIYFAVRTTGAPTYTAGMKLHFKCRGVSGSNTLIAAYTT